MNNVNAGCGKCKWFVFARYRMRDGSLDNGPCECVHPKSYGQAFDWRVGFREAKLWKPSYKNAEGDCEYFEPIKEQENAND